MSIIYGMARAVSLITFGSLWILQIFHWNQLWGAIGLYFGIGAIPVGLTLPFVHLFKTGLFSYLLFGLLAAFIISMIVAARTEQRQ